MLSGTKIDHFEAAVLSRLQFPWTTYSPLRQYVAKPMEYFTIEPQAEY